MTTVFTPQQLANFRRYVHVQKRGSYNMFDPRARMATGLDRDEFLFCIENYDALAKADAAVNEEQP